MATPAVTSRPRASLYRLLLPALFATAFLTEVKLVGGIANNITFFEVGSLVVMALFLGGRLASGKPLESHPILVTLAAMLGIATLSLIYLPPGHLRWGVIELAILAQFLAVVTVLYNVMIEQRIHPVTALRWISWGVLIAGIWVGTDAYSGSDITSAGLFRNRAHMGNYMLTGFWLSMAYVVSPRERLVYRLIGYGALLTALYAVAIAGRRSVYLSLSLGLAGLAVAFVVTRRGQRFRFLFGAAIGLGFLLTLYTMGGQLMPRGDFFRERVGMVGDKLTSAVQGSEDPDENFVVLQRRGVIQAFLSNPLLGIGWSGFYKSRFSPTGHEVHSTPLKFLAELGLVGFGLYLLMMGRLLFGSLRLFYRMRATELATPCLILVLASWSMSVSYLYNRHWTERSFWIFLSIFLVFEWGAQRLGRPARRPRRSVAPPPVPIADPAPTTLPATARAAIAARRARRLARASRARAHTTARGARAGAGARRPR